LAAQEFEKTLKAQHALFKEKKEAHIQKLEEVMILFEGRLREAQGRAQQEMTLEGAMRPVTEALIEQMKRKLHQIYELLEDLAQPEEPEEIAIQNLSAESASDSDESFCEPEETGYEGGVEEDTSNPFFQEKRRAKKKRNKVKYKIPEVESEQLEQQQSGCYLKQEKCPPSTSCEKKHPTSNGQDLTEHQPKKLLPAWKTKTSPKASPVLQDSDEFRGIKNASKNHIASSLPPQDKNDDTNKNGGSNKSMTLLDQIVAMILLRYPKQPRKTDQEHFQWIAEAHQNIRDCWMEEFGHLPSK